MLISAEAFNDLQLKVDYLVKELRKLGKDNMAFRIAVALSNELTDIDGNQPRGGGIMNDIQSF
jgi:hypothetical protein